MNIRTAKTSGRGSLLGFGGLLIVVGAVLALGGTRLLTLGGSWYYLLAGLGFLVAGVQVIRGRRSGVYWFAAAFAGTVLWTFAEAGFDYWPLVPRLGVPMLLAFLFALLLPRLDPGVPRTTSHWVAAALALIFLGAVALAFMPHFEVEADKRVEAAIPVATGTVAASDWRHYGRTPAGTRFAPFNQIDKDNVDQLEVAWMFRTGSPMGPGSENQNTPIQVGDAVYICTPLNVVFAIDAETGAERWRYDPEVPDTEAWNRCRGVSYYEAGAAAGSDGSCAARIVLTTMDARLIELDAATGALCPQFGQGGMVDLKVGLGEVKPAFYMPTSAPTVMRDLVLVGGWVFDNREVGEPSGVVRAFSAQTGELIWAWDLGNPAITKYPPEGETYTRGTPNVWTTPAFDDSLGLVYLPTGNSTPDYWGGHRTEAAEKYTATIVALDIETGRERWRFQTMHHDLWDYDLPAQPALYDVPDGKGGMIPALVQVTKTGNIFLLDRRSGEPIAAVEEREVPQGPAPGDFTSPTQPFSIGMPYIGKQLLREADMWGLTMFDQLACRIDFRSRRYEGMFTPPGEGPSLQHPGNYGGMNWGSASINEDTGTLIVNDIRLPIRVQLVPNARLDIAGGVVKPHTEFSPQFGTPYAVRNDAFTSPLGIPCPTPPWGTLTGIDLKSRQIAWQRPLGTVADTRIGGIPVTLPVPIGMPTLGGPMTTRSGLVFYAGTQDFYLRAFDVETGKELWKGRLPVGAQATPMSYVSQKSGRQFVLVSAGGARESTERGDYLVAFSLPVPD